ncbi:DUF6531 domain-containing protein [Ramlibacter albus]|uniref:RHS repeat protein n=1 Tax=Ramlibacter albus TaxID=2079448 RepID=A0A923MAX0_9BURK|nr:DUF6531 domain-containing protein [Ramlibacter albus]MBC5765974.1 RHS repeat protein [Ramlibacter albus]
MQMRSARALVGACMLWVGLVLGGPALAAIQPLTGDVQETEVEWVDSSPHPLTLSTHYRSSGNADAGLGPGWSHNWAATLTKRDASAAIRFGRGVTVVFHRDKPGAAWQPAGGRDQLLESAAGLTYVQASSQAQWQFDAGGRLQGILQSNGWRMAFAYSATGQLQRVTNAFSRSILFGYDAGRLASVRLPDGTSVGFAFDAGSRLAAVTGADGAVRSYAYGDARFPGQLTSVARSGSPTAIYKYDARGLAVESARPGVGGKVSVTYPNPSGGSAGALTAGHTADPSLYRLTVDVTDERGVTTSRTWQGGDGRVRLVGTSSPAAGIAATTTLGANNLPVVEQDFMGVRTVKEWDANRELPLAVTKAAGTPDQQAVQTQWHPTLNVPLLVNEKGRVTEYTWDSRGNKLSQTVTDTSTGAKRTWLWTYGANNLPATMTEPGGGVWQYSYNDSGHRIATRDPLNRETLFEYDGAGRVVKQTEPGELVTTYVRDLKGRPVSVTRDGETTTLTYTDAGLASATLHNGYSVAYSHDSAQRLIGAADNNGASVTYTLDSAGQAVREEVRDETGMIALVTSRVFNELNALAQLQGASGQATQLAYDRNGELIAETDPLNRTTRHTLDALRRATATTFPDNASALQSFNSLDQLTQVVDPKGVATQYKTTAFDEVVEETSPDIAPSPSGATRTGT